MITVHEGVYRERINPPRGGESNQKRIVYQGAPGEKVVVKGSEVVKRWKQVENDTWKVTIPNSYFGDFNPYSDLISGDWFRSKGREHHTGAVYLNGHWLVEAAQKDDVFKSFGNATKGSGVRNLCLVFKDPKSDVSDGLWFSEVDDKNTTIWARFKDVDPNKEKVEINVRQ